MKIVKQSPNRMGVARSSYGDDDRVDGKPSAFQNSWKISEIVNPDGSVTIRRAVRHPDGTQTIEEDEYSRGEEPAIDRGRPLERGRSRERQHRGGEESFIPSDESETTGDSTEDSRLPSHHQYYSFEKSTFRSLGGSDGSTNSSSLVHPKPISIMRGRSPHRKQSSLIVPKSRKAPMPPPSSNHEISEEEGHSHFLPPHFIGENDSFARTESDGDNSEGMDLPHERTRAVARKSRPTVQLLYNRDRGHFVTVPVNEEPEIFYQEEGSISPIPYEVGSEDGVGPALPNIIRPRRSEMKSILDTDISILGSNGNASTTGYNNGYNMPFQSQSYTVKVFKRSSLDKIGVHVGLRRTKGGKRLIVSKISPTGLVASSPMQPGDIVEAINGHNFSRNPDSRKAFEIVRNAKDEVVFSMRGPEPFVDDGVSTVHSGSQNILEEGRDTTALESRQGSYQQCQSSSKSPDRSRRLSELMHIIVEKEKEEKTGIELRTKDIPNQRVLYVSQIAKDGLFADTPLKAGDIIISINDISFHSNADADLAFSVINSAKGKVEIIARQSKESLRNYLLLEKDPIENEVTLPEVVRSPRKHDTLEFDEESYGASLSGYNAVKSITIKKNTPMEKIGIRLKTKQTEWGALLVVSKIEPNSPIDKKDISVGDIVVSINDISFRDDPIPDRAAKIIQFALREVTIEYQKEFQAAVPPSRPHRTQVTETVLPNGRRIVKTENFDADEKSLGVKIHEVQVPIGRTGSDDVSALASSLGFPPEGSPVKDTKSQSERIVEDGYDELLGEYKSAASPSRASRGSKSQGKSKSTPGVIKKDEDTFLLTVRKKSRSQTVGISMGTTKGALYITRISPSGLFVGKPILPGDTVLAINNVSFRENPVLKDAYALILNAPEEVSIEIRKTSLKPPNTSAANADQNATSTKTDEKRRFGERLFGSGTCFQKHGHDDTEIVSATYRKNGVKISPERAKPQTAGTSLDIKTVDPFFV